MLNMTALGCRTTGYSNFSVMVNRSVQPNYRSQWKTGILRGSCPQARALIPPGNSHPSRSSHIRLASRTPVDSVFNKHTVSIFRRHRSDTSVSASGLPQTTPSSASVLVFTTATCKHCKRAKAALTANGIVYEEIQLQERLELLKRLKEVTGRQTVPQVTMIHA
eukprot:1190228-Prorocentrum_minimum.AAC.3